MTLALLAALFQVFVLVSSFEDIVPTQPAPLGLVRDPQNDCLYVIYRRQIQLVCVNGTSHGTTLKYCFRRIFQPTYEFMFRNL
jgi:hypothetical protein